MTPWLYARLALVLAAAVGACVSPLGPSAISPISWAGLVGVFFFFLLVLIPILALQRFNRWSAPTWQAPSWKLNPLDLRQPLQFFHLAAYVVLVPGVVILARLISSPVPFYPDALVPFAMGVGTLLGIQLSMVVFRSKMATPNNRWRGP